MKEQAQRDDKILRVNDKRRRIRRRVPNLLWYFVIVQEEYIYSCTTGKNGQITMEILKGDTIDISEWMEFDFTIYSGIRIIWPMRQNPILVNGLDFHTG